MHDQCTSNWTLLLLLLLLVISYDYTNISHYAMCNRGKKIIFKSSFLKKHSLFANLEISKLSCNSKMNMYYGGSQHDCLGKPWKFIVH